MSWSVSAQGRPAEVLGELASQFPVGLDDDGERETVKATHELIEQILSTFDSGRAVAVVANGHMGFSDWATKHSPYQQVAITVTPK